MVRVAAIKQLREQWISATCNATDARYNPYYCPAIQARMQAASASLSGERASGIGAPHDGFGESLV